MLVRSCQEPSSRPHLVNDDLNPASCWIQIVVRHTLPIFQMKPLRNRTGLAVLGAMLLLGHRSGAEIKVQTSSTPGGVCFAWAGERPKGPATTVFFFSGGMQDSFYPEAISVFGPGVFCVTLDLPAHGADRRADEPASIRGWRYRLDRGEDTVADLVRRARMVLDHLIAQRYADPGRVAVFGTSRGGFMAYHFAAADPRVTHVAAFSPVTDLLFLKEFRDMADSKPARALSALRLAGTLHDRGLFVIIGNADDRVSTPLAIRFTERVIEEAESRGQQPRIELHIGTSNGHECPAGTYPMAARWLLAQWKPSK